MGLTRLLWPGPRRGGGLAIIAYGMICANTQAGRVSGRVARGLAAGLAALAWVVAAAGCGLGDPVVQSRLGVLNNLGARAPNFHDGWHYTDRKTPTQRVEEDFTAMRGRREAR